MNSWPTPFSEDSFEVPAVEPRRTFLEKIFLLHEEFRKEEGKMRHFRMSRHLYDLHKIKNTDHGKQALEDEELYSGIVAHRKLFSFLPWVDYNLHQKQTLDFIPPQSIISHYEEDYKIMTAAMIYGNPPSFHELIVSMQDLQSSFRGIN
jgi:hypothetical protein